MRKRGGHTARLGPIRRTAEQWVEPDDAAGPLANSGKVGRDQRRISGIPAVAHDDDDCPAIDEPRPACGERGERLPNARSAGPVIDARRQATQRSAVRPPPKLLRDATEPRAEDERLDARE